MEMLKLVLVASAWTPAVLMSLTSLLPHVSKRSTDRLWRAFLWLSGAAMVGTWVAVFAGAAGLGLAWSPWVSPSALGLGLAALVQQLGTLIGGFSAR